MTADQLSLFDVLPLHRDRRESPYRPLDANGNGHDPFADLVFSEDGYAETEADVGGPARASRCECAHPITDGDRDELGETTCLLCGRASATNGKPAS